MDSALLKHKSLVVLYAAFLLGSGSGCTSTPSEPPQEPAPNYQAIIAKGLIATTTEPYPMAGASYFVDQTGIFLPDRRLDQIEISDTIRMVQTSRTGWAWQTCMRLNVDNMPGTYAVFIAYGHAVYSRAANWIDNCEAANYVPLNVREYNPVKQNARKIGK
jgi:hypothetical protein